MKFARAMFRNDTASSFRAKPMCADISQTPPVRHPARLAAITLAPLRANAGPPPGQANLLLEKADSPWSTATLPAVKAGSPWPTAGPSLGKATLLSRKATSPSGKATSPLPKADPLFEKAIAV